jgi:hypothetical protein
MATHEFTVDVKLDNGQESWVARSATTTYTADSESALRDMVHASFGQVPLIPEDNLIRTWRVRVHENNIMTYTTILTRL